MCFEFTDLDVENRYSIIYTYKECLRRRKVSSIRFPHLPKNGPDQLKWEARFLNFHLFGSTYQADNLKVTEFLLADTSDMC